MPGKAKIADLHGDARLPLSDAIAFLLECLVDVEPSTRVRVHDENWADLVMPGGKSVEDTIRDLRKVAETMKSQLSAVKEGKGSRSRPKVDWEEVFVEKLSKPKPPAATLCVAEDGHLYLDAIPATFKSYLVEFVGEAWGEKAEKATMTRGVCHDIRSSASYRPNT